MARISMAEYAELDAEGKKLYDGQVNAHGRITNMKRTLLRSSLLSRYIWSGTICVTRSRSFWATSPPMLFSHAISQENSCLICSTYFRKILIEAGKNPDSLDLDETEALVAEW